MKRLERTKKVFFQKRKSSVEEESLPVEEIAVPADTGMGLPEGIDQKGLPFSQDFHEEETEEEGGPHFRYREYEFSSCG